MGITWRAQCCQEIFLWSIRRAISALLCDRLDRLGISNMSVTIRDVANAAEVSTATVSNVLNKTGKVGRDTRRLVLSTVKRLGYIRDVHARHLASRDRRTLGIIVSDIENPFFPEVIKSFEIRARQLGYDVILSDTNYDPRPRACPRLHQQSPYRLFVRSGTNREVPLPEWTPAHRLRCREAWA